MKEKSVTLNFIVNEYIRLYGVKRWSVSIYGYYTAMYDHYVKDTIGKKNINVIKVRTIDEFYKELLSTPAVRPTKNKPTVTPSTIQKIHKFLKAAVEKGIGWELCDRNPFRYATLPKFKGETRECWTAEEFFEACSLCRDDNLLLAMHLAFATTLRLGEICGLTWNNIDVSAEAIKAGKAYLYVDKQLQRINTGTYKVLMNDEVSFVFPDLVDKNHTTTLVLKSPKTSSSVRKVFIPETVALLLVRQYARIQEDKKMQGSNYNDYNLVFCWSNGNPIEGKVIQKLFEKLIAYSGA